ncbi:hypothetical protein JCM19992_28100 [Thermostilla marina]
MNPRQMRTGFYFIASLAILLLWCSTIGIRNDAAEADPLPPLEVSPDAPRLAIPSEGTGDKPQADNSPCFVCHANFAEEPLAVRHARENVGCVDCHGQSFAHRNDENNTTPPDVMYARNHIDEACGDCHETHDVPARAIVNTYLKRGLRGTPADKLVCTDCHGRHRLAHRTVRWDKTTRKLLPRPDASTPTEP